MADLFDTFPNLKNDKIIIRKMTDEDIDSLSDMTSNDNVYKYIPLFLYKKSMKTLLTAIKNLGSRDFEKKKMIIAGIYLCANPDKLVGLAEMFDYKKRANKITIGYCITEECWNQGIATNAAKLMVNYLTKEIGIKTLKAYVMPENIYSAKVLLNNGFKKEDEMQQEKNWGRQDIVDVEVYTYE